MTPVADLIHDMTAQVRRAPLPTLVRAYVQSARDFCERSLWLLMTIDGQTEAGQPHYALGGDADLEVIGVRAIALTDGRGGVHAVPPLDPVHWNPNEQPAQPRRHAYIPEARLALYPTPDATYAMRVSVEVQPTLGAVSVPDELVSKWHQGITNGALDRLLTLPGEDWSNPALAERKFRPLFLEAVGDARANRERGFNTGTVRARIPRIF